MFGIFRKRSKAEASATVQDWSFIGTDVHSHLIPGIDDGPEAVEDSLELLRSMYEHGFSKVVTTPHISADYYPNTRDTILNGLEKLVAATTQAGIPIAIEAAAEYMIDERFLQQLKQRAPVLYFGDRYVLVEMGFIQASPLLHEVLFELQAMDYKPVLAHPERYNYYHAQPLEPLMQLKESGCLFQLNTIALSGYYGQSVNICANKMLTNGLYSFLGSDIHHRRHLKALNTILRTEDSARLMRVSVLNNTL
ncbi:tyrosine-protein phosphatase [Taibaiella koreensis]|uniref:tyrosine-protein phosphatase n=1 Tax=Taibaiella koreensis TaxID=1268548 RepID=UPI000E59A26B|nr:CpsB/CapC family capsule biosynthesis tyrosine phosphatase [Taibaiella koreensis]